MIFTLYLRIGCRDLLPMTAIAALALALGLGAAAAATKNCPSTHSPPAAGEDCPNTHNMLVFGEQTVFLSHLPMFDGLDQAGADYVSPHRYQVILEAALTKEQLASYLEDRRAHPETLFYTLGPKRFVLSLLLTPPSAPQLDSFVATVFRGHLEEQPNHAVAGLENVSIKVARLVHGRKFDPRAAKPASLEYLLIGRGRERFLAHAIFTPPDFDHVLTVNLAASDLTDRDLNQDIRIVVPGRKNVAAERLRQGEHVEAMLSAGSSTPVKVQLEAGPEIYFEEGELLVPPNLRFD